MSECPDSFQAAFSVGYPNDQWKDVLLCRSNSRVLQRNRDMMLGVHKYSFQGLRKINMFWDFTDLRRTNASNYISCEYTPIIYPRFAIKGKTKAFIWSIYQLNGT